MIVNKQEICDLLLPCLKATGRLDRLEELEYVKEEEVVLVKFNNGFTKTANVAMDSGIAMIKDILSVL